MASLEFNDPPGESVLLIARFTPHPCAEIMQGCSRGDEWFDWLEKFDLRRQHDRLVAMEEEYARLSASRSVRRSGLALNMRRTIGR